MEFKLNNYHRNVSNEELIADLFATAEKLSKKTLSKTEYSKNGNYHWSTIERRFGSWSKALAAAKLKTAQYNSCRSLMEFVEDVKKVASILVKETITIGEYKQHGKYCATYPFTKGKKWSEVLKLAGLSQTPYRLGSDKEISNEELFADIERVWIQLGRQPTITDAKKGIFKFSQNTFCRRFGGWRNVLAAFIDYINSEENVIEDVDNTKDKTEEIAVKNSILHKTNREPSRGMRFRILQRDHFRCFYCGRGPQTDPSVELVVDHFFPWSKGGETTYENLRTSCKECNLGKSDRVIE